ncbi:MAG: hypothetical protein IKP05_01955 [Alphaproteobacteria bacterium]|nr:hypothetical protein [Alphaproteobacteria bacterium]
MKTKIIYISGNELFDMADIRAAFEEVRAALSLGNDTVLFGVPVDNDDALIASQDAPQPVAKPEPIIEPIVDDTPEQVVEEKPEPKPQKAKVVPISEHIVHNEPKQEEVITDDKPSVVPILSVLGTNSADKEPDETEQSETFIDNIEIETTEPIDEVPETPEPEPEITEQVTITDIITDDVPEIESEKTLEQLLESMTPLGEDADKKTEPVVEEEIADEQPNEPVAEQKSDEDDTDITLEKLATEFVASQDKIETPSKPAGRGKIGKLKNILPFKKARHDDSGLMGDLFGWAGVAANDEDFTIPGFFTNATSNTSDNDK